MRRSHQTYHSEPMLRKIHSTLVQDLNPLQKSWFEDPRNYTGPGYLYWKPYDYKVMSQLENYAKRILFSSDPEFDELAEASFEKFLQSQSGFGLPERTKRQDMLIRRARAICHGILGEFDFDEFSKLCSFGKRAAQGLPYRDSYLDKRTVTLNGSKSQLEWFKGVLCTDIHLHRAVRLGLKQAKVVESLEMSAVPKSFKAARIIAPDTTTGGFLSRGLGALIRKRLEKNTHINLKTQQHRHRDLALRGSGDGYCATVDMKSASDSFVWEHVEALIPESWHSILDAVRIPIVTIGGTEHRIKSVMLMGSGHTFPLQTVLFYSVVKAVLELMGSHAKCDVYGDDIIFPAQFSVYVIGSLHDMGFTVNVDKSFVDGPFKESCGGDYHTGIDVRPYMPEHTCGTYDKYEYTELLHKLFNGLISRWEPCEIPVTLDTILLELLKIWGNLCPVPENETDTAGLKFIPSKYDLFVRKPTYVGGIYTYLKLVRRSPRRKPKAERPYYWNWLHKSTNRVGPNWLGFIPTLLDTIPEAYESAEPVLDVRGREVRKGVSRARWVS